MPLLTSTSSHRVYKKPDVVTQKIVLTGFDLPAFQNILNAIENINQAFSVEVPEGTYHALEVEEIDGRQCIRFQNRLLTPKFAAGNANNHDMKSLQIVDPYSILRKAAGKKFLHTEENVVQYFRKRQFAREDGSL